MDTIADFDTAQGDALDLSDLIAAYDPANDTITDFIQITANGSDVSVAKNRISGKNSLNKVCHYHGVT